VVVNTVVQREDGSLWGDSTDGVGLIRSLDDAGLDVKGKSVLVLGAGGAARASILALGRAGATVTVAARKVDAAAAAAQLAYGGSSTALDAAEAEDFDVVVNATPLGMADETLPIAVPGPGQWAVDLIYHPSDTPFLVAARARGAEAVGGIGMLIHQAAIAFEAMTGRPAPLEAMRAAGQRP